MGAASRPIRRVPTLNELEELLLEFKKREKEADDNSSGSSETDYDIGRFEAYGCAVALLNELLEG